MDLPKKIMNNPPKITYRSHVMFLFVYFVIYNVFGCKRKEIMSNYNYNRCKRIIKGKINKRCVSWGGWVRLVPDPTQIF